MAKTRRRFSRSKNMVKRGFKKGFHTSKKGFKKGFNAVRSTSKRYMPKVKTGLENVGSKVTKTATKSVPILQKASRDLLGIFGMKKKSKN
jgi:hypothetical protein